MMRVSGVVGRIRHSGIVVPPGVEVGLHILGGVAAGNAVLALLTSQMVCVPPSSSGC